MINWLIRVIAISLSNKEIHSLNINVKKTKKDHLIFIMNQIKNIIINMQVKWLFVNMMSIFSSVWWGWEGVTKLLKLQSNCSIYFKLAVSVANRFFLSLSHTHAHMLLWRRGSFQIRHLTALCHQSPLYESWHLVPLPLPKWPSEWAQMPGRAGRIYYHLLLNTQPYTGYRKSRQGQAPL